MIYFNSIDAKKTLMKKEGIFKIEYDGENITFEGNFTNGVY
jgi:hypothetical protein